MTVERGVVSLGAFEFACGETIPDLEVAYEAYGTFDGERGVAADGTAPGSNAVLVCHALTGSQHVADVADAADVAPARRDESGAESAESSDADPETVDGDALGTAGQARAWWDAVVGPGKAIDTNRYFVVCANVPGSCYGTTGPSSTNPETGEPYGSDFPPVTVGDWTRAQRRLLDDLGVGRLHAVVGGSVGGMNVLDWATRYPDDVNRVIPVAAAPHLDPQCLAIDAVARRAITSDPAWNGGDYYGDAHPDRGLGLARQLGHVMYLSKSSMDRKFGRRTAGRGADRRRAGGDCLFPPGPTAGFFPYRETASYLDHQAETFVDRFDANSYLYLLRAMDEYDLAAGYDSDAGALAAFDGEALVVSFTGDWHFTVEQSAALSRAFRDAGVDVAHHVVDSDHGHDAFLVEPETVGPPIRDFLADGVNGRAVTDGLAAEAADGPAPADDPIRGSSYQG